MAIFFAIISAQLIFRYYKSRLISISRMRFLFRSVFRSYVLRSCDISAFSICLFFGIVTALRRFIVNKSSGCILYIVTIVLILSIAVFANILPTENFRLASEGIKELNSGWTAAWDSTQVSYSSIASDSTKALNSSIASDSTTAADKTKSSDSTSAGGSNVLENMQLPADINLKAGIPYTAARILDSDFDSGTVLRIRSSMQDLAVFLDGRLLYEKKSLQAALCSWFLLLQAYGIWCTFLPTVQVRSWNSE